MTGLDRDNCNLSIRAGRYLAFLPAWALFVCLAIGVPASAGALPCEDLRNTASELHPSHPVAESVSANTPHHYWFHAARNSVFKLAFEQHDMNLRVSVVRPDGTTLIERTTPISAVTSIVGMANLAGAYVLTVTPQQMDGRVRRFSIGLKGQASPGPREAAELSASKALEAGDRLAALWTESGLDEALTRYRIAESEWRRAGDVEDAASALVRQGDVHSIRGQFKAALASYQAARALIYSGSRVDRKVDILNSIAALALAFTDLEEARKDAEEANRLSASISYDEGRGRALTELGGVEFYRSNLDLARSYLDQAMAIWAKTPDRQGEVLTLMNLSYLKSANSEHASAYEDLSNALRISRLIDDEFAQARAAIGIGNYCVRVDELARARYSFNVSLKLLTKMGSVNLEAIVLDNFGYYLENVGDPGSYGLYKRAALMAQHADNPMMYSNILSDLSRASIAEARPLQALRYSENERQLALSLQNGLMIAQSLRDIGEAYMASGNVNQALRYFTEGLDPKLLGLNAAERVNGEIEAGRALERLGRLPEALNAYREAATISHSAGSMRAEADALYRIACLETAEGRLDRALPEIEKSVSLVESLRTKVSADDTRILWFASFHSIYTLYIDVLMQLSSQRGDPEMARHGFQIAEQSIARSFVELLHGAQVETGNSEDLSREDSLLRLHLAEKTADESRLLSGGSPDAEALRKITSEISDLHDREAEIQSQFRAKDPEYFRMQVNPLGVEGVQSLLGDEEMVLEYSLGVRHSYLWAICKNGFSSYELPEEGAIEPIVRRFRQALVSPGPALQTASGPGQPKASSEAEEHLAMEMGKLLVSPVPNLARFKRIIVVADGALQYLPFGVLATNEANADASNAMKRLADDHEIINLPSMTALSALRSRRPLGEAPSKGLLVFADPVFESDDPRIDTRTSLRMTRFSARDRSQGLAPAADRPNPDRHFPRLPGSRQEAEVIAQFEPKESTDVLLGFDANRDAATSPEIGRYRFIHFATHSVVDDEHPEASGVILSLFKRDGSPEDGFLGLRDIYGLKLAADIVVLSACDTALGKNIKGEGIVGLTRGFMYAGARRVVATLWRVDDDATSVLMQRFYKGILEEHKTPAASLWEAQLELRKQARWQSPYFWGAFVIEGEWLSTNESVGNARSGLPSGREVVTQH